MSPQDRFDELVWSSKALEEVQAAMRKIAATNLPRQDPWLHRGGRVRPASFWLPHAACGRYNYHMATVELQDFSWERMIRAVEKVRERLARATTALEQAGVPYAVIGGNAVAAWVSRVDEAAVRNTQDVDLLIRRSDLGAAATALESAGFVRRHAGGIDMFLDGPGAKARDAVHVLFAGEKVRPEYVLPAADVIDAEMSTLGYRVVTLEALVRMKLTSYRRKDQVHLLDLLGVGLIDETWCPRMPGELAERLKHLIDTRDDVEPENDEP